MIIFGTKTTKKVLQEGTFYCPNCNSHQSYKLIQMKKWGHLYWIPIIPMDNLIKFVECKGCGEQYKEKILDLKMEEPNDSTKPDQKVGSELDQFFSILEMVQARMIVARTFHEDDISKMSDEQKKKYLAFELGVIEYYDQTILRMTRSNESLDAKFFNFLIFYAKHTYAESSETVFQFWHALARSGEMLVEREIGFNSVNNQTRVGHYPGRYLKEAVGF